MTVVKFQLYMRLSYFLDKIIKSSHVPCHTPIMDEPKLINLRITYAQHKAKCYGSLNAELFEFVCRMHIPYKVCDICTIEK